MDKALLSVESLSLALQQQPFCHTVVEEVSFSLYPGKTLALVGESGCGKTLTSLALTQLLPPGIHYRRHSKIKLQDTDLLTLSEKTMRTIRGKRIGMIFQEPMTSLNPVLTVGQQINETLQAHTTLTKKQRQQRIISLFTDVGLPKPEQQMHRYPHQLSGGMKQRVMIAMSIAAEPDLLIADEPTTALDVTIQAQILNILKKLQQKNKMAILLITHDLGVVANMADDVMVMYAGQVVESAPAELFFSQPQHPYSKKLFSVLPSLEKRQQRLDAITGNVPQLGQMPPGCRFANRCDFSWSLCRQSEPALTQSASTQQVRCHLYSATVPDTINKPDKKTSLEKQTAASTTGQVPLLELDTIRIDYPIRKGLLQRQVGAHRAVDDVSLRLMPGKTLALVGESGCGKTSLAKGILGLIPETQGRILLHGKNCLNQTRLHSEMQIVFQDPFSALNPRMLVGDLITEGLRYKPFCMSRTTRWQEADHLLNAVGLDPQAKWRYAHEFSGGQRQRLGIARALAVSPDVLICDEPTSALDLSVQAQVLNLLRELQQQRQLAYLFITHNLAVVSYMADEVAVMTEGKIVEQGTTQQILQSPQHPYTRRLLQAVPQVPQPIKVIA